MRNYGHGLKKENNFVFFSSPLLLIFPTLPLSPSLGVLPNSEFLRGSKIKMDSKNSVIVDKVGTTITLHCVHSNRKNKLTKTQFITDVPCFLTLQQFMRTNVPGVFCGGDVASFPLAMAKDQRVTIGHWQMAQAHGN